jgi:hypothetical protein
MTLEELIEYDAIDEDIKKEELLDLMAKKLVAEGWLSTSNKWRYVSRFKHKMTGKDLVSPELWDTDEGKLVIDMWDRSWSNHCLRMGGENVETLELTTQQYKAFKRNGGTSA